MESPSLPAVKGAAPKISATEPIKFRPGHMGDKIAELMKQLRRREPDIELSSVLRDGLEMFWPHISAGLLVRQRSSMVDKKVTTLTLICAKALENGVTIQEVEEILAERMEGALSRR